MFGYLSKTVFGWELVEVVCVVVVGTTVFELGMFIVLFVGEMVGMRSLIEWE